MATDRPGRPEQRTLDFDRGAQLSALRECVIPDVIRGRKLRSVGNLKAVLIAMDGFARKNEFAWPSISALCEATGLKCRAVQRALVHLENLGILDVRAQFRADGSQTSNVYSINWSRVFELAGRIQTAPSDLEESGNANTPQSSADLMTPGGVVMTPPQCPEDTGGVSTRHPLKRSSNHHGKRTKKTHDADDVSIFDKRFPGGWDHLICREELTKGRAVLDLWRYALARRWIGPTDLDQVRFFALCRASARNGNQPGAYLTSALKTGDTRAITQADEDAARCIIKWLAGQELPRQSDLGNEVSQDELERRRRESIQRIKGSWLCVQ